MCLGQRRRYEAFRYNVDSHVPVEMSCGIAGQVIHRLRHNSRLCRIHNTLANNKILLLGGRHPFLAKYKVGYRSDGKILALTVELYSNAGMSLDLSAGVLDRALFHIENTYHIPNLRVSGHLCRTNLPSNTAFRGFGGPQGMFVVESIISDIAQTLNKPHNEVSCTTR